MENERKPTVAQIVDALRKHEWIPIIKQARECLEDLARENERLRAEFENAAGASVCAGLRMMEERENGA